MSRLLVALQFGLIALVALRVQPARIGPAFMVLMAAGVAVGGWALAANRPGNFFIRPEPRPGGRLVTHGPYAFVRHPMYLAVLLATAAFAVAGDEWQWVAWFALAGVLAAKARREERGLVLQHPGYEAYRAKTRAIVPYLF
ncbi:MAG TPA: methyltransferase [Usitatibacteraceae bacterium]|nr:methyltransferase [Usitatibacteraceae bacterium]